jgi:hypothetical protein
MSQRTWQQRRPWRFRLFAKRYGEADLSDLSELLVGTSLLILSIGALIASLPRHGKKAWFVGTPFVEPGASILMITAFAVGLILIAAYFTTIDDATLSGVAKHL